MRWPFDKDDRADRPSPTELEELVQLRQENAELREMLALSRQQLGVLKEIREELRPPRPHLAYIKLAIGGVMPVGPVTFTVGDKRTATVLGFDQNGAAIAIDFNVNPVTFADDNQVAVSDAPTGTSDALTALAPGVMNLTATCAGFSDSEVVTVIAAPAVLSSIKISID